MDRGDSLKVDPASVESFLKRYGVLHREDYQLEPSFKIHMPDKAQTGPKIVKTSLVKAGNQFKESIEQFESALYTVRQGWAGNSEFIQTNIASEVAPADAATGFQLMGLEILQGHAAGGVGEAVLETENLWAYICYLFLIDYAERRTAICERDDCPTPYFIQQRKGQRYCSHDCAVLENVRRFRSKARAK